MSRHPAHPDLPSFPTRRSSDLLSQCRNFTRNNNLKPVVRADTAGSAAEVAALKDATVGAIASSLAAEIYGLEVLATDIERSEEHTSELQSRLHLVCRLLLEKKK